MSIMRKRKQNMRMFCINTQSSSLKDYITQSFNREDCETWSCEKDYELSFKSTDINQPTILFYMEKKGGIIIILPECKCLGAWQPLPCALWWVKPMGQEHSQNVGPALLNYQTHPRPHTWECPHHRALPYKRIPFTTMMTPMSYYISENSNWAAYLELLSHLSITTRD